MLQTNTGKQLLYNLPLVLYRRPPQSGRLLDLMALPAKAGVTVIRTTVLPRIFVVNYGSLPWGGDLAFGLASLPHPALHWATSEENMRICVYYFLAVVTFPY